MPYQGGKLTTIFDPGTTRRASRRMAERAIDRLHDLAVANTPIDTGNLRTSWYQRRPRRIAHISGFPAWEGSVATDVDYAPHVEFGTGLWGPNRARYPIVPVRARFLRWIDPRTGREVFSRRVMHPGSPGQHMMGSALARLEAEAEAGLFNNVLADWIAEIERLP